jgi:hypothetical protein
MRQTQELEHSMRTFSAAATELARALDDDVAEERTIEFWPPLGTVQRRIVALDGIVRPEGMRPEEIAAQANRPGGPSTLIVLDTLYRRGVLERLSNGSSPRYRLAAPYRRQAAPAAATPRHRAPSSG